MQGSNNHIIWFSERREKPSDSQAVFFGIFKQFCLRKNHPYTRIGMGGGAPYMIDTTSFYYLYMIKMQYFE